MSPQPFNLSWFSPETSYQRVLNQQLALVEQRIAGHVEDTLMLGEHGLVITSGRGEHTDNVIDASGVEQVAIERGGDVTLHAPGQLVGYPIFLLGQGERDLHGVLRKLEEVIIQTLATVDLEGYRREGLTGVWVEGKKMASIGIAVKKWVVYHGFALNIDCDLSEFSRIRPCGLEASAMTSVVEQLQQQNLSKTLLINELIIHMERVFNRQLQGDEALQRSSHMPSVSKTVFSL